MQMLPELLADRGDHAAGAMTDVEAADTAGKIEIAITVDVLDDGAIGARSENERGIRRSARNGAFASRHQSA